MNPSRRKFLLGSTAVVGAAATPLWARWLCDQMAKLQPKPRVQVLALDDRTLRKIVEFGETYGWNPKNYEWKPLDVLPLAALLHYKEIAYAGR